MYVHLVTTSVSSGSSAGKVERLEDNHEQPGDQVDARVGQAEAGAAAAGGVGRGAQHVARGGCRTRPGGRGARARPDQGLAAPPRHRRRTPVRPRERPVRLRDLDHAGLDDALDRPLPPGAGRGRAGPVGVRLGAPRARVPVPPSRDPDGDELGGLRLRGAGRQPGRAVRRGRGRRAPRPGHLRRTHRGRPARRVRVPGPAGGRGAPRAGAARRRAGARREGAGGDRADPPVAARLRRRRGRPAGVPASRHDRERGVGRAPRPGVRAGRRVRRVPPAVLRTADEPVVPRGRRPSDGTRRPGGVRHRPHRPGRVPGRSLPHLPGRLHEAVRAAAAGSTPTPRPSSPTSSPS